MPKCQKKKKKNEFRGSDPYRPNPNYWSEVTKPFLGQESGSD
jgi:hypothetical protein